MGIIPHAEMKGQVDKATAKKLYGGDEGRACGGAEQKGLWFPFPIDMVDRVKTNATADRHRPMRISAKNKLQRIIRRAAEGKASQFGYPSA